MKRFTIAICTWWIGLAGIAAAQSPVNAAGGMESRRRSKRWPHLPRAVWKSCLPRRRHAAPAASPGEAQMSREARAHEQYLLQSQAQAESVHRAAVARAEQRTRRLESQRWFGISNSRPTASVDPVDGDYSPGWVSNYPFYPFRWVGSGEPWGFSEGP